MVFACHRLRRTATVSTWAPDQAQRRHWQHGTLVELDTCREHSASRHRHPGRARQPAFATDQAQPAPEWAVNMGAATQRRSNRVGVLAHRSDGRRPPVRSNPEEGRWAA